MFDDRGRRYSGSDRSGSSSGSTRLYEADFDEPDFEHPGDGECGLYVHESFADGYPSNNLYAHGSSVAQSRAVPPLRADSPNVWSGKTISDGPSTGELSLASTSPQRGWWDPWGWFRPRRGMPSGTPSSATPTFVDARNDSLERKRLVRKLWRRPLRTATAPFRHGVSRRNIVDASVMVGQAAADKARRARSAAASAARGIFDMIKWPFSRFSRRNVPVPVSVLRSEGGGII
jgi:hypothetical protein